MDIANHPFSLLGIMVGVVLCIAGWLLYRFPPRKMNALYGYRTSRSMKSKEAWDYAQQYAGGRMALCGALLIVLGMAAWPLQEPYGLTIPLAGALTVVMSVIPVILTERRLKALFDEHGARRQ